uniref:BURP domain-containing protein n=1 Tax=Setaria digitata TaxID=48799 RepID=A0A915Q159_9BILA
MEKRSLPEIRLGEYLLVLVWLFHEVEFPAKVESSGMGTSLTQKPFLCMTLFADSRWNAHGKERVSLPISYILHNTSFLEEVPAAKFEFVMLLKICLFAAATFSSLSYCFRLPRSALWHSTPEYDKGKDKHNVAWSDWTDGHDSGYLIKKNGHHQKDSSTFHQAIKQEAEQHSLKSAAGAGKHAAATAEKGASKHADQASSLGKDIKAKTFGFFDYQYKQPEYHVEQFYTDEKHRRKFGADRSHHSLKDHESDAHEASGWGKHGKGYHNDAKGLDAHERGGEHQDSWASDFHKGYEHARDKDYSQGHEAHKDHYDYGLVPEQHHHHHHHGYHDGWTTPYEHGYGHELGSWSGPAEHDTWGKWRHGWEHGWD